MAHSYILTSESPVDMPYTVWEERNIPIVPYHYILDDVDYEDDMGREEGALEHLYQRIKDGALPSTSQVNAGVYQAFFEEQLKKGDVLHIAFSSALSGSCSNAMHVAEELQKKYPDRKIAVVDSRCASSGFGLFVQMLADKRDEGLSFDELKAWAEEHRQNVEHYCYSTNISYFRRTGRLSGPTAMVASVLKIVPIMRMNRKGELYAFDKRRGVANSMDYLVDIMKQRAIGGTEYDGPCCLSHSVDQEEADQMREKLEAAFPNLKGKIGVYNVGYVISSHTGPGTVSLYFLSEGRED